LEFALPQSRTVSKDIQVSAGVSEGDRTFQFKPLIDFRHRMKETAKTIADARQKGDPIPIAGWAMPGAVVKHIAHNATSWQDTPERYLLLMCAPLGCLWYSARAYTVNGDWDQRTQTIVVVPQPTDLEKQADALYKHYRYSINRQPRMNLVAGVADAALQAAVTFEIPRGDYRVASGFYVMRFGTVAWSQQKTRTGALSIQNPQGSASNIYRNVMQYLSNCTYTTSAGQEDELVMPMKERIAKNVLEGKPWYLGISEFMTGKRGRLMRRKEWREGMRLLVEKTNPWTEGVKREFVELMHEAISNRYGRISAKAKAAGADLQRAFSREYDRMVLDFLHCRTREMLRETLMRFIAQTYPRFKDGGARENSEREVLFRIAFQNHDWREVKDLCLLAIATYRGRYASEVASGLNESELEGNVTNQ
jgi:CRISPR-associated protein Cas8a1/Csx13